MCGIAGIWNGFDKNLVGKMMDKLRHRGPDAHGMHVSNDRGILGHRRLSIMDPEGGNQPIYNEDKDKAIIANGEIYNFPALRKQLARDHDFYTTSDTEAVLHLYEDLGPDAAARLDGMFAFAIADGEDIFAARDPIGIKPLYFGELDGALVFGSEAKSFPASVENLREFPPGTWFHSQTGFSTFYTVPEVESEPGSAEQYAKRLRRALEESVKKRLMSDVPLGSFLSGGLDSSIIAAIARQHKQELHTFAIGVEGSADTEAARLVADHIGSIHHEYHLTEDEVAKALPRIIRHLESFDQDLVRSSVPCYFVSRLASQYVKVILTGEGADELFGGYTYYKDIADPEFLHKELRRSVASLHNINLQRVDRMTMAHSIEGRVPFLDTKMIDLSLRVPPELKLAGDPPVEKWILRKAFEDLLPEEIVWRDKEQFDEGSGSVDLLGRVLENVVTEKDAERYTLANSKDGLRSPEECHYHRVFMDVFDNPQQVLKTVGRWAQRPDWAA